MQYKNQNHTIRLSIVFYKNHTIRLSYSIQSSNRTIRPSIVFSQKSALYVQMQYIPPKIHIVRPSTMYLSYQCYTLSVVHLHAKHYMTEYNVSVKST